MDNEQEQAQEVQEQEGNAAIRYDLHNAYAFVEGQKSAQSFSAFTAEEAHDRFIERVEGRGTPSRPNVIDRVDRVAQNISAVVAKIKAMPDEAFRSPDENDVNPPEESSA